MKKKQMFSRLVALMCVFSMLLGTWGLQAYADTGTETETNEETELTTIGLADLENERQSGTQPIKEGKYVGEAYPFDIWTTATSFIDAVTVMNIKLDATKGSAIYFASTAATSWDGIRFYVTDKGTLELAHIGTGGAISNIMSGTTLEPHKVGLTSFIGVKFKLALELRKIGEAAELGVYINDQLYDDTYYTISDASKLGNVMYFTLNAGDVVTLEEAEEKLNLSKITLSDLGITEGIKSNGTAKNYDLANEKISWINSKITMNVKFSGSHYVRFMGSNNGAGDSIHLEFYENGNILVKTDSGSFPSYTITPDEGEGVNFYEEFKLSVWIYQYGTTDLAMRIYVNDQIYNDEYLLLTNATTGVKGNGFYIHMWSGQLELSEVEENLNLTNITLADLGITDGLKTNGTAKNYDLTNEKISWINSKTTMNIKFNGTPGVGTHYVRFAGDSNGGTGSIDVRFSSDGTVQVYLERKDSDIRSITPAEDSKVNFSDTEFKLAVWIYQWGESDLAVRVYVNDQLYGNTSLLFVDALGETPLVHGRAFYIHMWSGTVELYEVEENLNLSPINLSDLGVADGTYNAGGVQNKSDVANMSLINAKTTMNIKFNTESGLRSQYIRYSGTGNCDANSIEVEFSENGSISIGSPDGSFTGVTITPDAANAFNFYNNEFKLSVWIYKFRTNDLAMRIYVNDQLYNDQMVVLANCADKVSGGGFYIHMFNGTVEVAEATPTVAVTVDSKLETALETVGNVTMDKLFGRVLSGENVTATATKLPGYIFKGWYLESDVSDEAINTGAVAQSANLVYTFAPTVDTNLVAVYAANGTATITLNGTNFAVAIDDGEAEDVTGDTYTKADIRIGQTITITATEDNYINWVNSSNKVVTQEADYSFVVTGDVTLTMNTKGTVATSAFVEFVSDYGQVIAAAIYDADDEITLPTGPSKAGYIFDKWNMTASEIQTAIASDEDGYITVRPLYTANAKTYNITVYVDGAESTELSETDIKAGKAWAVTAPVVDGKIFQYWTDAEDAILGYEATYFMQVTKDIVIKAVYGDTAQATKPVIAITNVFTTNNNDVYKISFSATRSIPEGYTLVEHGMLANKTGYEGTDSDFVIGGEGVSKIMSTATMMSGVYTLNVNVTGALDTEVVARGYLIVRNDATGNEEIYYTDVVRHTYNEVANQ